MYDLDNVVINKPKAIFSDYFTVLYGVPKAGKTTFFSLICEKMFDSVNNGLLMAFEKGYKGLKVRALDIHVWDATEAEIERAKENGQQLNSFVKWVDVLVQQANTTNVKFIGIDTADIMYEYACDHVVKIKRKEDKKNYKSIGDIGYGAGYPLVSKEINTQLQRLLKAGYGVLAISHCVDKKFTSRNGTDYDKTTISLPQRARDIFVNMADFILFIDIAKEELEDGRLTDKRYIWFRADGTDLEAGSRFKNVPNKIEYDIDEFKKTFEHAIESMYESEEELQEAIEEQKKEREKAIESFVKSEKDEEVKLPLLEKVNSFVSGLDKDGKVSFKDFLTSTFDSIKYKTFDEEQLQVIVDNYNL